MGTPTSDESPGQWAPPGMGEPGSSPGPGPGSGSGTVYGTPTPVQETVAPAGYTGGHAAAGPDLPEVPHGAVIQDPDPVPVREEILVVLGVAVALAVLGFALGLLWHLAAPGVPAVMTSDGAVLAQPEQEQMIAAEGWYLIITVLTGIAASVVAWVLLRRYRGWAMIIALAAGSVASGILTWWTGHHIGLAHAQDLAQHAPVNTAFTVPPNLRIQHNGLWHGWLPYASGDLLAMAIAATLVYLVLAGFSAYPALRPPKITADPLADPVAPGPVSSDW